MKNIKKSIFCVMMIVACVSGMDELSPVNPAMKVMFGVPNMLLSIEKHQKKQQRAMEVHQLEQQITSDNHNINQQQAKDSLQMAKDNHQVQQQVDS